MPRAIVVTGTPGTGKTTISKHFAKEIGARYLSITRLVNANALFSNIDRTRRTKVIDLERTRPFVGEAIRESNLVAVIDTHVPDAISRAQVKNVLVLRCHPLVLEARLRRKGWRATKIRENVLAEILDACYTTSRQYYGANKVFQLDTSTATVSKSVSQAGQILTGKAPRGFAVDWIGVLKREHLLEKYAR
jgi:adenylate kinase